MENILEIKKLNLFFDKYQALYNVDLTLKKGVMEALVGESGCGKSMTAMSIMRLLPKTAQIKSGEIYFKGENLLLYKEKQMRELRGNRIALIPQDPMTSLNPLYTVGNQLVEAIRAHSHVSERQALRKAREVMDMVCIPDADRKLKFYPHEFSGGQRQRIAIARALVTDPQLLLCDEPVSALDVSIQAQILNLLKDLQEKKKLTYVFVSHDMSVISHISDRVLVMYLGQAVELAEKEDLFEHPLHPYTQALMQAVPIPDPREQDQCKVLEGEIPSPMDLPSGCPFCARCKKALAICKEIRPQMAETADGHQVACHLYTDGGKQ